MRRYASGASSLFSIKLRKNPRTRNSPTNDRINATSFLETSYKRFVNRLPKHSLIKRVQVNAIGSIESPVNSIEALKCLPCAAGAKPRRRRPARQRRSLRSPYIGAAGEPRGRRGTHLRPHIRTGCCGASRPKRLKRLALKFQRCARGGRGGGGGRKVNRAVVSALPASQ